MHISAIANGLGAQSMELLCLAIDGEIPATVSITADTGWERDRLWSDGRRTTAKVYFEEVVVPLCVNNDIVPSFVRAQDGTGRPLPSLFDYVRECARTGKVSGIPVFGSNGGRMQQTCTDKWKIRALRQEVRRMGATTARFWQGIHYGEADRRVRGQFMWKEGEWSIYQTTVTVKGVTRIVKWLNHGYPLVDRKLRREHIIDRLRRRGVPYLISSECDGCPHKDLARWDRTEASVLAELAELEKLFKGEYFFTDQRIPLLDAIENLRRRQRENPGLFDEPGFGCSNAVCGV